MTSATSNSAAPDNGAEPAADLSHRSVSPYNRREKILRVLWNYLGQKLFRFTFHNWYGTRNRLQSRRARPLPPHRPDRAALEPHHRRQLLDR